MSDRSVVEQCIKEFQDASHNSNHEKMSQIFKDFQCPPGGRSLLIEICRVGDLKGVGFLLDQGENINYMDNTGWTPLKSASCHDHLQIVELLLSRGALVNQCCWYGISPVHVACRQGHSSVVKVLVERGAAITNPTSDGWYPLGVACDKGHEEVVKYLIGVGGSQVINQLNKGAYTAAMIAKERGAHNLDLLFHQQVQEGTPNKN